MDLRDELQKTLSSAYVLERELGGGGMSRVFVADERRLNRKVVIKVLSTELAAGVSAERFEREIQLAASLQQANIVPILAAGETNGLPFYTMPLVDGQSLRARLARDGALPIATVIHVLGDVAKALSYAHERGVVHRDIKPDNVLLSGGTAVVTDFGIAKALSAARVEVEGAVLTQLGTSIGTPAYMSPEQAAGDPNVDHRADIYSLGCMAYELLTGQVPFANRTPARMLAAHITETPAPVSQLRPDTPKLLEQLVMRSLAKEPSGRPQSGTEIVDTLDAITGVTSGSTQTASTASASITRTLGWYAAAAAGFVVVARASIIALGLPDWVFTASIVLAVLGVPVLLVSWLAQRSLQHVTASSAPVITSGSAPGQTTMATLAIKASPYLTTRRLRSSAMTVVIAFVVVVAGFMVLRSLGIGPQGSLLAAGKLQSQGQLIVTNFSAPDTSLGTLVNEAVRTNLGQSHVISIMTPVAIRAALQRMQRPDTSRLDLDLAREVAQREGISAIVDGSIRSLAGGYALSLRLVSADSARELAAFQETADSPRELLQAIDKLTRRMRGRIGESLREVRASPPLEQVTTGSLQALRIYAEAARFIDMGGNPLEGIERLREAVRMDTGFAMAWRKLGVALNNAGLPRASVDSALERAYRFRDRLTDRERLLAEGTYFQLGPGRNRPRAIRAYEALLAIDPNESGAANNLGSILSGRREFARAESLFRRQIVSGRATSQQYTNLIGVLFNGGKVAQAESVFKEYRQRFPNTQFSMTGPLQFLYERGEFDSVEARLRDLAKNPSPVIRLNGLGGLTTMALLHGKLTDVFRYQQETQKLQASLGGQPPVPLSDSLEKSWIDLLFYGDTARAVRRMELMLAKGEMRKLPFDQRPEFGLATLFALSGNISRARDMLAEFDAGVPDSVARRVREPERHQVLGTIALAEHRYQDAVREYWRADTTYDGPDGNCTICMLDDVGRAWDAAGAADSAIFYWERFLNTPYFSRAGVDGVTRPHILKRLGELYESKNDAVHATQRYREFIKLWEHADAPLQSQVADAKYRLSRLADVEKK